MSKHNRKVEKYNRKVEEHNRNVSRLMAEVIETDTTTDYPRSFGVRCDTCQLEPMMGLTYIGALTMALEHNAAHHAAVVKM